MKQDILRSKVMWLGVIAQVISILILTNVIPMEQVEVIKGVAIAVLEILTLFGIINSPNTKGALK